MHNTGQYFQEGINPIHSHNLVSRKAGRTLITGCNLFLFNCQPYLGDILTVSSISSPSFLTWKGHQPFTLLCLNRDICGTLPSCFNMLSVHCLEDFAPLGNWFRSSVSAPERVKEWMPSYNGWPLIWSKFENQFYFNLELWAKRWSK